MDTMSLKEIILSPIGLFCVLMIKTLLAALFLCGGIQLFDFKNMSSFFTLRRVVSLFLLINGVGFLIDVLFVFSLA